MMAGMDELPPDPDLDDLPRELAEREGPFVISVVDEDGTHYAAFVTKDDLARGFADARRVREDDER
jgi:heat shock protein HspQ